MNGPYRWSIAARVAIIALFSVVSFFGFFISYVSLALLPGEHLVFEDYWFASASGTVALVGFVVGLFLAFERE